MSQNVAAMTLLKKQLDEYFRKEKVDTRELIKKISVLIFQYEIPNTDAAKAVAITDIDVINKLVNYYDGGTIKLPTKQEWKDCLMMLVYYYFKNVKGMDWKDIRKILNISSEDDNVRDRISLGLRVKSFSDKIRKELSVSVGLKDKINKLEDREIVKALKELLEEGDGGTKRGKKKSGS
jgi:hypothetical protein